MNGVAAGIAGCVGAYSLQDLHSILALVISFDIPRQNMESCALQFILDTPSWVPCKWSDTYFLKAGSMTVLLPNINTPSITIERLLSLQYGNRRGGNSPEPLKAYAGKFDQLQYRTVSCCFLLNSFPCYRCWRVALAGAIIPSSSRSKSQLIIMISMAISVITIPVYGSSSSSSFYLDFSLGLLEEASDPGM